MPDALYKRPCTACHQHPSGGRGRSSVALEEIAKSLISGYEEGLGTAGAPNLVSERGCAEMTDMVTAGTESQEDFGLESSTLRKTQRSDRKGFLEGLKTSSAPPLRVARSPRTSGRGSLVASEASGGDATPRSYATRAATLSRERQKRSFPLPSTGSKCDLQHPR